MSRYGSDEISIRNSYNEHNIFKKKFCNKCLNTFLSHCTYIIVSDQKINMRRRYDKYKCTS